MTNTGITPPARSRDRWLFRPVWVTVGFVAAAALLVQLPGPQSVPVMFAALMAYPTGAVAVLASAVVFTVGRQFRRAASVCFAGILGVILFFPFYTAAKYLHLALTIQLGIGQLGEDYAQNGSSLTAYDWSVGLITNGNTFLIYDPTDEIALPIGRHKHPIASENGFGEDCAGKVEHLLGHYYVCNF